MEPKTGGTKGSDVVLQLLHAVEEKDYDRAERFLTKDFSFSGPTPKPVDRNEFIEVHRHLLQAIPDWRFNFTVIKEDANEVTGRVHITGTHSRDLTMPMMPDIGTIHATGKKISLPEERVHIKVKDNKITRFEVDKTPNGGVTGILSQLGVAVHERVH
jgi:predicted ester cyclase